MKYCSASDNDPRFWKSPVLGPEPSKVQSDDRARLRSMEMNLEAQVRSKSWLWKKEREEDRTLEQTNTHGILVRVGKERVANNFAFTFTQSKHERLTALTYSASWSERSCGSLVSNKAGNCD